MLPDSEDPPRPPRPSQGPKLVLGLAVVLLIPLVLIFAVFPRLQGRAFDRIDELNVAQIASLRAHVLNRREIDDGEDVGPYLADPADYPALLAVLQGVPEVDNFTGVRGPWIGEYRVLTTTGRTGTVRFYWQPVPTTDPNVLQKLRFQIGPHRFEGGDVRNLFRAVEAAAPRGQKP